MAGSTQPASPPPPRFVDDPLWRHLGNPAFRGHDGHGFRNAVPLEESDALLTGSSHVYGINLLDGRTWPELLQANGHRLFNASLGAWGCMQYALVADRYLRPHQRRAVICVYTGFDVYAALRHSLETSSPFARRYLDGLDTRIDFSWQWKAERDQFLAEQARAGLGLAQALERAHARGMPDTSWIELASRRYFLEPRLRLTTMSLRSGYVRSALELSRRYLRRVAERCADESVPLAFVVFPTRERALAEREPAQAEGVPHLPEMLRAELQLTGELVAAMRSLTPEVVELDGLYRDRSDTGIFVPDSNDGHPSAQGAELLAHHLAELFPPPGARPGAQPPR